MDSITRHCKLLAQLYSPVGGCGRIMPCHHQLATGGSVLTVLHMGTLQALRFVLDNITSLWVHLTPAPYLKRLF